MTTEAATAARLAGDKAQELTDAELERLDTRIQEQLKRRHRRLDWAPHDRWHALAYVAANGLGPNEGAVDFACSESNQLVIATRLAGGDILFYQCVVVHCSYDRKLDVATELRGCVAMLGLDLRDYETLIAQHVDKADGRTIEAVRALFLSDVLA